MWLVPGELDFVKRVSSKLPMLTIADMLGVPDGLSEAFAEAGDNFISVTDPDTVPAGKHPIEFAIEQMMILREIGVDVVNHRRREHPADDVATSLAQYEVDGQPLTDDDPSAMMLLLSAAGNDTTKQTTSHTIVSLDRNPEQRKWLMDDFAGRIGSAIEEFIRHATPVLEFGRMATADTDLGGQHVARGDKDPDGPIHARPWRFVDRCRRLADSAGLGRNRTASGIRPGAAGLRQRPAEVGVDLRRHRRRDDGAIG